MVARRSVHSGGCFVVLFLFGLSSANPATPLGQCDNSNACEAEADDTLSAAASASLLQVGLGLHHLTAPQAGQAGAQRSGENGDLGAKTPPRRPRDPIVYDRSSLYGLTDSAAPGKPGELFQVTRDQLGRCTMTVPNVSKTMFNVWADLQGPATSRFAFDLCPTVLPRSRTRRLDVELDTEVDGFNASGWNPSLVAMPDYLKSAFPDGRWLAVFRVGHDQCPSGSQAVSRIIRNIFGAATSDFQHTLFHVAPDAVDETNEAAVLQDFAFVQAVVAILDDDFRTLTRTQVRMANGESFWDDLAFGDPRLFSMRSGEILIGFIPYNWEATPDYRNLNDTWWFHELVAKLHVSSSPPAGISFSPRELEQPAIFAWVDRLEARDLRQCPDKGLHAPGPKKNLGFFEDDAGVHAVDWVHPTRIGRVDVEALVPDEKLLKTVSGPRGLGHVDTLCFGYEESPSDLKSDPWQSIMTQDWDGMKTAHLHNGPPLLHIPEAKLYLGVGHLHRGYGGPMPLFPGSRQYGRYGHHYTHQFFALEEAPPHRLAALSGEFCFESGQAPGDCETVQFVSSLNLQADKVIVSYGVMDCESYASTLELKDVLGALRPVS